MSVESWVAAAVSAVAALFAGWQAWEARKARKGAEAAEARAALAAERSAGAAERSAAAQERLAEAVIGPEIEFTAEIASMPGLDRRAIWKIWNTGRVVVTNVVIGNAAPVASLAPDRFLRLEAPDGPVAIHCDQGDFECLLSL